MPKNRRHLFGPVPSRRLGRSLGVDLIPFKTCSMNCLFCQLGDAPRAVVERREYVPTEEVLEELAEWKASGDRADHVTLAGSGEPTLHARFGDVLQWIRDETAIPSVLLTNGSLLWLPEVRAAAAKADKVKVTLDAWDEASFRRLHRPAPDVTFERLVAGELAFRREYAGELSVEVFLVAGLNDSEEAVKRIAERVGELSPDRIDLNTAIRPPADPSIRPVSPARLAKMARLFDPPAAVPAGFSPRYESSPMPSAAALTELIRRHPATAEQLARDFSVPLAPLLERLDLLVGTKRLHVEIRNGERYYLSRDPER